MRELFILAVLLPLAMPARADTEPTVLHGRMPALTQGRGSAGTRFSPAPMPNPAVVAPTPLRDPNAIKVTPGFTRAPTAQAIAGDGFARGSAYSGDLEHRGRGGGIGSSVVPSLNMSVPMQVDFR